MMNRHTRFKAVTALVLCFGFKLALAVVPSTMNYQGHLTDSSGVPIDGSVNMVFAIYDVESGGTARWSEPQSVTVVQGVFSVELGGINPFPPGLESPLWMGLKVDADAEMTPRRQISSVGFAFKASDADTLEGVSAASLDQSAHLSDGANPHGVTASQIGAADAGILSGHIGNTSNPHGVSSTQIGAASSADLSTHAASPAVHHLRFTSGEAVASMGTKSDTNALNHDKYTDADVVTAMLANDGAGSTLDSDKVDGLEASELIDAAQDEVRTPISSLPFTITQSGSYYLTGNLDGSTGGIDVAADDVTLDLMGFTIDGGGAVDDRGIDFMVSSSNTVRNGTIKGFGRAGIYQDTALAQYTTVLDVQVLGNGTLGTNSLHSGILLVSNNSHVERCTVVGNSGSGIIADSNAILISNRAYNNGAIGIYGGNGAIIKGNNAYNNSFQGIRGGDGAVITDNSASGNTGVGISGTTGSSLIGNTASKNSSWGISVSGGALIKDNSISSNNTLDTVGEGGLRVVGNSRVVGNTLYFNRQNNIYIAGDNNAIENNLATRSSTGIYFEITGNFYANNRASLNSVAGYGGVLPTGSGDGGGNVSF